MNITSSSLFKAAGAAAAVGGAIFIAVQSNHPAMEVASVETTERVVRSTTPGVRNMSKYYVNTNSYSDS